MRNFFKKYWWVLLLSFIIIPVIMNIIMVQPRLCPITGDDKSWLSFWGSYITAIATFAMVVITWLTLKENRKQIDATQKQFDATKKQWEINDRAYILVSINNYFHSRVNENTPAGTMNTNEYLLVLENTGNQIAKNISIKFDKNLNKDKYLEASSIIPGIEERKFTIKGRDKIQLGLWHSVNVYSPEDTQSYNNFDAFQKHLEEMKSMKISISYEDCYGKYNEDTMIEIKDILLQKTNLIDVLDYIKQAIGDLKTNNCSKKQDHL